MLKFIEQEDVYYPSVLKKIRKSTEQLQPLYEAFRNALEAIDGCNDKIILRLFHSKSSVDNIVEFERFEIEDSGVGFNDVEYDRFKRIFDSRKGKTIKVLAESNSSISFKKQNLRVLFMIKMLPIEGFSKYLSVKSTSMIIMLLF